MRIYAFVNELSLTGQYHNKEEWLQSFDMMLRNLSRLLQYGDDARIYLSSNIFTRHTIHEESFSRTIKYSKDKHMRFQQIVQKRILWDISPQHDSKETYCMGTTNYVNTSVAEAFSYSQSQAEDFVTLLSFRDGFPEPVITVNKVNLNNFVTAQCLDNHMEIKFHATFYGKDCTYPPRDSQTFLADTNKYEKTNIKRQQGRIVYRKKEDGTLLYVDNKHGNGSAHIEVFDINGKWLGVSGIQEYKLIKKNEGRILKF